MWLESLFAIEVLYPEQFGYDRLLAPVWYIPPHKPIDVLELCTCKTCVQTPRNRVQWRSQGGAGGVYAPHEKGKILRKNFFGVKN